MSRTVPAGVRTGIERQASPDALLGFATITHPNLAEPLRIVSDVLDYVRGGVTYTGVLFTFRLVSDGEEAAWTEIAVQNVDRRIGAALEASQDRATVSLEVLSTSDFDLSVSPRTEIGTAAVVYAFRGFELIEVSADAIEIRGKLRLRDYSTEPWPASRATEDRLPGLFR